MDRDAVASRLADGGFVAPGEEADELIAAAGGDAGRLEALVRRRETGEPLAWICGRTVFCGRELLVHPGVYVPRWHSEALARRAVARLPRRGVAIDLCTGAGAVAATLAAERPSLRVVASDVDPRAVACAVANGVEAYAGDLFAPLPPELAGRADVVTAVVPYVPTPELGLLQRDTRAFESPLSYDGGADGTGVLRRVLAGAPAFLRPGGALLLELGAGQGAALAGDLARLGYADVRPVRDEDGDERGVEATLVRVSPSASWSPGR